MERRLSNLILLSAIWTIALPGVGLLAQESPATEPAAQTPPAVHTADQDLAMLAGRLTDDTLRQDERDEAARRLANRPSAQSTKALGDALSNLQSAGAQLAVARALGEISSPNPGFVDPLFVLLTTGDNRSLTDAAAIALGGYRQNSAVLARMIEVAHTHARESIRQSSLRGLGRIIEKKSAEAIFQSLDNPRETPGIHDAAADALIQMTGLTDNGHSADRWRQWWSKYSQASDAEWKLNLLDDRANRYDLTRVQLDRLSDEIRAVLSEQYRTAPESQHPDMLGRYLRSNSAAIRSAGAHIAYEDAANALAVPAQVRQQLRQMVGDSSPVVRAEVAHALWAMIDAPAVDPLLVQLAQEQDDQVRVEIIRALAKIGDVRAANQFIPLLTSDSGELLDSTISALSDLGPQLREKDHALATAAALALRDAFMRQPASARDRQVTLIDSMGRMREPALRPMFQEWTRSPIAGIRRAAVKALGELRDSRDGDVILNVLNDDQDATVRLEAVRALRWTATPEQAESLWPRLSPNGERDEQVRDAVWLVLQSLFPNMPPDQLDRWADRFNQDDAHNQERRLAVLKALRDELVKRNLPERLAYTRQNLGDTQMKLAQYPEAAREYQAALDYWAQQSGPSDMVTEGLIRSLMEARLRARQYVEATQFAAKLIAAQQNYQETVGPPMRDEAQRLLAAQDYANAMALTTEALKMSPPLVAKYSAVLLSVQTEARQRAVGTTPPATPAAPGAAANPS